MWKIIAICRSREHSFAERKAQAQALVSGVCKAAVCQEYVKSLPQNGAVNRKPFNFQDKFTCSI